MLKRWLDTGLGLWRWHHVRIASALRPAVAVVRLREAVAELPAAVTASGRIPWFRVRDKSRGIDVVLHVTSNRRGGMTVIRARVVATESGCDLVGAYGWPLAVRVFLAYCSAFVVLFWCLVLVTVRSPSAGTGSVLPLYVAPPVMLLVVFAMTAASVVEGRRDALIALDHIAGRLDASS